MTIESLIEELEQIIDEGKSVPFTSNQIVDVERLRTTIEDMRLNMPDELMQARKIASERKEILTAAQSTAEGIITAAKKKADELISEHEITKGAEAELKILWRKHVKRQTVSSSRREELQRSLQSRLKSGQTICVKAQANTLRGLYLWQTRVLPTP